MLALCEEVNCLVTNDYCYWESTMARKAAAVKKPMTKSQIFAEIADNTGLTRKEVGSVFDELSDIIERHMRKRSAGSFTLP